MPFRTVREVREAREAREARDCGGAEVPGLCRVCKGDGSVCSKRNNSLVFSASEVGPVSIESS